MARPADVDAQRLATLTLTSGSSGMPKAAAHSYANHLASAAGVLELMAFQREDCWLLSLPLFHVSGQGIVWRWLAAGARLAVREMHPLNEALAGCTHASLVPTQLWRLLAQPLAGMTLKAVLLGGAMIPVELTERAEEAGIRCWCGYGLTELASTVCAKRADARPGVGLPLGGREIKLVDEEVWIRAESLALGYWRHGHLQPLADEQGWFATRDRGAMAEGNCVFSAGWKTCSSAAVKGQPEDIERVLAAHPQITQAFVVPVADAEFGQRPVAVIDGDPSLSLATLLAWSQDKLANFQRPTALLPLPDELKTAASRFRAASCSSGWRSVSLRHKSRPKGRLSGWLQGVISAPAPWRRRRRSPGAPW